MKSYVVGLRTKLTDATIFAVLLLCGVAACQPTHGFALTTVRYLVLALVASHFVFALDRMLRSTILRITVRPDCLSVRDWSGWKVVERIGLAGEVDVVMELEDKIVVVIGPDIVTVPSQVLGFTELREEVGRLSGAKKPDLSREDVESVRSIFSRSGLEPALGLIADISGNSRQQAIRIAAVVLSHARSRSQLTLAYRLILSDTAVIVWCLVWILAMRLIDFRH